MDRPIYARDQMTTKVFVMAGTMTVADALAGLQEQGGRYGVVIDQGLLVPVVLDAGSVANAADQSARVSEFVASLPWHAPVEKDQSLADVILEIADTFVADERLNGLVVVDDEQLAIGVIPRTVLAAVAADIVRRGGDIGGLEGLPIIIGRMFSCAVDQEEKLVTYYEPSNPPRCRYGHVMKRGALATHFGG